MAGPTAGRWTLLLVLLTSPGVILAQEATRAPRDPAAPLRFRRIYAPADRVADWPTGSVRYVPVDAQEFERLAKSAQQPATATPNAAGLVVADYDATLGDDGVLKGSVTWTIDHTVDSPTPLKLAPLTLALGELRWQEDPEPATIGLADSDATTLIVDRRGEVSGKWTLVGRSDSEGQPSFSFQLPSAAVTTIRLTLPGDITPVASTGLLTRADGDQALAKWQLLLGGQTTCVLKLLRRPLAPAARPDVFLREATVYDFSSRGLDLTSVWKIDLPAASRGQLGLLLDEGLQLVSARWGETDLSFTRTTAGDTGPQEVSIELPETLSATERALRLTAIGPLVIGKSWRIPRIRARDVSWQEGTCTLLVHEPLVVQHLATGSSRESKFALLPEQSRGESFEVQLFSDSATIDLLLSRDRAPLRVASSVTVELTDQDAHAELAAHVSSAGGRRTSLTATIAEGWVIDEVTSIPADALASWEVGSVEPTARWIGALSAPLSNETPLTLHFRAHRRAPARPGFTWLAEDIAVLRFPDASFDDRLLVLKPGSSHALHVSGVEELPAVDPARLAASESALFASTPRLPIYRLFDRSRFVATVGPAHPPYTAEIVANASLNIQGLDQTFRVRCEPAADSLSRVIVQLRGVPDKSLVRWHLANAAATVLHARKLAPAELAEQGLGSQGEAWELSLTPPCAAAFEIQGACSVPTADDMPLILPAVPQASASPARLVIESPADQAMSIDATGVVSIPTDAGEEASTVREVVEYAAEQWKSAEVRLRREVGAVALPSAFALRRTLASRIDQSGQALERATFSIHNAGRRSIHATLPPNCADPCWWVDGELQTTTAADGPREIMLPARRQVELTVEYRCSTPALHHEQPLVARWPAIDLPTLASEWRISVPRDYGLMSVTGGTAETLDAGNSWAQRLLGPLVSMLSLNRGQRAIVRWQPPDELSSPVDADHSTAATNSTIPDIDANYTIHVADSDQVEVRLQRSSRASGRFLAALVVTLAGCHWLVRRTGLIFAMFMFAVAVALMVPLRFTPVASGIVLGLTSALAIRAAEMALRLAPRSARRSTPSSPRYATSSTSSIGTLFLAAAGGLAVSSHAVAQQTMPRGTAESSGNVFRVFIPVDENEKPTDDKYQVPEQLYDELRRREAQSSGDSSGWLIRSARYHLELNRGFGVDALSPGDVTARYQIAVLRADVTVRIPTSTVRPLPQVRRDGQAIDLAWDIDEQGFVGHFTELGMYDLELRLRAARGRAVSSSWELPIPPVPDATLDVRVPRGAPAIEFPSAYGATSPSADGSAVSVQLGPANRLALKWDKVRPPTTDTTGFEADVWEWLQIQPGSVTLHARLDLRNVKAPLNELLLSVDPRLRPLPVVDRSGAVASVQAVSGDPQSVRIQMARPLSDQATIPVSFLLTGSSGVGQLSLPHLVPRGATVKERLLAVSIDPSLESTLPSPDEPRQVAVADFMGHWGAAPAAPQFALKLAEDEFSIATRPREPSVSAQRRLAIAVGDGRLRVRFDAELTSTAGQGTSGGAPLQYTLHVPPELRIEHLSVEQDGIERLSRFARSGSDQVTLFLAASPSGRQRLRLDGWLPVSTSGIMPLPNIEIQSVQSLATTVLVFAQPSVQVALDDRQGLVPVTRTATLPDIALSGRLVASLSAPSDKFSAMVRVAPNTPRVELQSVFSIAQANDNWAGRLDCRLQVADGYLDQVVVRLPPQWTGPFEITPSTAWEVDSDASARRLVVRPAAPVTDLSQFTIHGPVRWTEEGAKLEIPQIELAGSEQYNSYVVLPRLLGGRPIEWQIVGAQPARISEESAAPQLAENSSCYRVSAPGSAIWQPTASSPTNGTTADVEIAWSPDALLRGVARFVVDGGQPNCPVEIPPTVRVLSLLRSGSMVTAVAPSPDRLTIPLDPSVQRQTIEIVFSGEQPVAEKRGQVSLQAPRLVAPEPVRTDWTVWAPASIEGPATVASGGAQLDNGPAVNLPDGRLADHIAVDAGRSDRFSIAGSAAEITVQYGVPWYSGSAARVLTAGALVVMGTVLVRRVQKRSDAS